MTKRRYQPTPMGDKRHYVYELRYPEGFSEKDIDLSNVVFYVGKGTVAKRGMQRIDYHEAGADRGCLSNHKVIRAIWLKGMQVVKRIPFETDDEREALEYEKTHIARHISPYLTNVKETAIPKQALRERQPIQEQQITVTTYINPALILNGRIRNRGFFDRLNKLKREGNVRFLHVIIKCKKVPCPYHEGCEVVILDD